MTIIEFFDKTAIENMLSAMLCKPDRVVFIGHNRKQMEKSLSAYREVLAERDLSVKLTCRSMNRNDLQRIVEELSAIVEQDENCVFNLDGGEELYLVAVGMVAQKYPGRVSLHRFNIRNNTIIDCDADGNDQLQEPIRISVPENIRIYGGRSLTVEEHRDGMYPWDFNESFRRDLMTMWRICCGQEKWNSTISTLGCVDLWFPHEDPRGLHAIRHIHEPVLVRKHERYDIDMTVLRELEKAKLISWLTGDENDVEFIFKNEQVKRCLTKAGQTLELMATVAALDALEEDGTAVYNDVQCGVYIDWDGVTAAEEDVEVTNEVDVMLMKGAVPVFISCKNGNVTRDELFMLDTVARRFGDKYARKVLIATQLDKMGSKGRYIRARAEDMDIRVVDDFDEMTYEEMKKEMKCLWLNSK